MLISRYLGKLIFSKPNILKSQVGWIQWTTRHLSVATAGKNYSASTLIKRPPVVTIMGHVDHGKTTLLDNLRNSQIVEQEFGGITQHIGAFVVPFKLRGKTELLTFLDTPGHAAFASMRQRGADVTDIVVLVVSCDDGVLDQTVESIRYAKNSNVPIIVAVNKIDKCSSHEELEKNVAFVRRQLVVHDIVTELDGGDTQLVKISALKGLGMEELKEAILALAETLTLKGEVNCSVKGHIIESSVDVHRGKLCTILVKSGELKKGTILVGGSKSWAKVRALFDERGQMRQVCGPGMPIQITGWRGDELPNAGDQVIEVLSESEAKSIVNKFHLDRNQSKALEDAKIAAARAEEHHIVYRELLAKKREGSRFGRVFELERGVRPKESIDTSAADERKLNLLLRCDVDGSLEALLDILDSYDKDNGQPVKLDLMHYGVGAITDNDLRMASSFPNSVIYGFNVKPASQKILLQARRDKIDLKLFNVIYHLIDDLKSRLSELIPEVDQEVELGRANVLQEFCITEKGKKGKIKTHVAGCSCSKGILRRDDAYFRLLRNNQTITENMVVKNLKHLKEDTKEVEMDRECGVCFVGDHEQLEFKPGDTLVCYHRFKVKPKLKWELKGFS